MNPVISQAEPKLFILLGVWIFIFIKLSLLIKNTLSCFLIPSAYGSVAVNKQGIDVHVG